MSSNKPIYSAGDTTPVTIEAFKNSPCSLHWTDDNYRPPSADEIKSLQKLAGWSSRDMGFLTGNTFTEKGCNAARRWKLPEGHADHKNVSWAMWRLLLQAAGVVTVDDDLKLLAHNEKMVAYSRKSKS